MERSGVKDSVWWENQRKGQLGHRRGPHALEWERHFNRTGKDPRWEAGCAKDGSKSVTGLLQAGLGYIRSHWNPSDRVHPQ